MLILREAMQVESKPGHIELSISRKLKMSTASLTTSVINSVIQEQEKASGLQEETSLSQPSSPQQQVVRIINHTAAGSSAKPLSTYDLSEDLNNNRFNRDAPSRRSMSEKRTKIGSGGGGANGLPPYCVPNKNQALLNRHNLLNQLKNGEATAELNPKRSHTLSGMYNKHGLPYQSAKQQQSQPQQLQQGSQYESTNGVTHSRDNFKRMGSFDSVISHNANFSKCFVDSNVKSER